MNRIIMNKKSVIFLLLLSWLLMITIPHFQPVPNPFSLSFNLIICALGFYFLLYAKDSLFFQRVKLYILGALATLLIVLSQIFTLIGLDEPYLAFSRFGSYTMFENGEVSIFGDLSHLTSAAECSIPVMVGENLCDPWGRLFNQNPDVVTIFRAFKFFEVLPLGIISTLIFSGLFFIFSHRFQVSPLVTILCFLSPVTVLAIDRGNETITLALIFLALILYSTKGKAAKFADIFLVLAGLFKIWPFALLILIHLYRNRLRSTYSALITVCILIYIAIRFDDFLVIGKFTQRGDIAGNSFGLALYDFRNAYHLGLLALGLLLGIALIKVLNLSQLKREVLPRISEFVFPLMTVYCLIWISGAHFSYRLLIIFPIIALLSQYPLAAKFSAFLIISLLSVRLQSSPVLTSSIFIIFLYFLSPNSIQMKLSALFKGPKGSKI